MYVIYFCLHILMCHIMHQVKNTSKLSNISWMYIVLHKTPLNRQMDYENFIFNMLNKFIFWVRG